MFNLGMPELLIILVIALIIFGAGKLPEIGSALGKGLENAVFSAYPKLIFLVLYNGYNPHTVNKGRCCKGRVIDGVEEALE